MNELIEAMASSHSIAHFVRFIGKDVVIAV
jgi:hypothetical protein